MNNSPKEVFSVNQVFGDKGYLSKVFKETLFETGMELITRVRKHMKPIQLNEFDNILLHKRSLIETVSDQLKNISQLEHARHRSMLGLIINLLASIISSPWQPKKPSLNLRQSSAHDLVLLDHSLYVSEV